MSVPAVVVFVLVTGVGITLDLIGRYTSQRCPTIGTVARAIHRRRFGGWLLFIMWAVVGWHLLAS